MPWVDRDKCTGCGTCVDNCPVGTILIIGEAAEINMDKCIHCGTCHDVCPEDAVRHDSEKIPDRVGENIAMTKKFMDDCEKYLESAAERKKCLNRMMKHFNAEKIIAEKTLEELKSLES
ncbi:MAG: 4Fe-4S binding protein [Actinobacteria bacterium]|nr:4Fe-4S binding protein [Actinomycetota bacterium]